MKCVCVCRAHMSGALAAMRYGQALRLERLSSDSIALSAFETSLYRVFCLGLVGHAQFQRVDDRRALVGADGCSSSAGALEQAAISAVIAH